MMKILHTADWHLDSPLQGHGEALRQALAAVPGQIFEICREEGCDLVLLSGDLFDGLYTPHTYQSLYDVLKAIRVPVFIAPGNHDYCGPDSPWIKEVWPDNVHIFTAPRMESVALPELDCRVYGAGFSAMDCPGLLEGFRASCEETYAIGVLHADPTQARSPYCPVTQAQVAASGLRYLALGHIHKADSFQAGDTLCAWPGCPMGRGYDEEGVKGVYIVTLDEEATIRFRELNTPRFYDWQCRPEELDNVLPAVGNEDYYRISLTGEGEQPDLPALQKKFSRFPNLLLRDKTTRPVELWGNAGEDSFEGLYFGLLKQALDNAPEEEQEEILLAAQISRQLLEGQEVVLP